MRILFLFNPTAIRIRYVLLQKFERERWEVSVALPQTLIDHWAPQMPGVHFIPFEDFDGTSIGVWNNIKTLIHFYSLFKRSRPDALFLGNVKPIIYGGLAARILRIKNIYGLISGLGYAFIDRPGLKRSLVRRICTKLYRTSLSRFTRVFFQNDDDRQLFVDLRVVVPSKTQVVNGTGVDLAIFSPGPFPSKLTFFVATRLIEEKGVFEYVAAVRQLKPLYPHVSFVLAGPIDSNPSAMTERQLKECGAVVEYVGHCRDMVAAIHACSVFVYPSYYREGIPRALLEALACGRPVITTDSVGCRETVVDGENGFKIPPKNAEALARAMETIIKNPDLLEAMGRKSRDLAEKRFDIHVVNEEMYGAVEGTAT